MKSLFALVIITSAFVTGCKQAKGEHCQITADCADGLVCNQAKQTCESTAGTGIDANLPIDAPADAKVDAKIDAKIDAI